MSARIPRVVEGRSGPFGGAKGTKHEASDEPGEAAMHTLCSRPVGEADRTWARRQSVRVLLALLRDIQPASRSSLRCDTQACGGNFFIFYANWSIPSPASSSSFFWLLREADAATSTSSGKTLDGMEWMALACVGEMRLSNRWRYLLEIEEFRLKGMNICAASRDFASF